MLRSNLQNGIIDTAVRAQDAGRTPDQQAAMDEYERRIASPYEEVRASADAFLRIAKGGRS